MIVDGKEIQRELKAHIRDMVMKSGHAASLGVIVVHEMPVVRTFVELKRKFALEIGIGFDVVRLQPIDHTTEKLLQLLLRTTHDHDGVVLQLPLPPRIELASVFKLFPLSHDVDVIGETAMQQFREGNLPILPPVVSAMAEILSRQGIRLQGKRVVVVGEGRLVGEPAAHWARSLEAVVTVVNAHTLDIQEQLLQADVVISGAGSPNLITPDMVKDGVVLLDAGTSDVGGALVGDIDPSCAEKALLFTPTPGGIGPVTVAKLFENLITLSGLVHHRAAL